MNKKGFTLIEILAVIIIIGIIAMIAVPTVSQYIKGAEDTTYKSYENSMKDATKNKVSRCLTENDMSCQLPEETNEKSLVYLTELIDEGLIDEMKNPETKKMCESDISYVEIKKVGTTDYEYVSCLYCGDYITENSVCTEYFVDEENPVCGDVTGSSKRWTNGNRTISVKCSDATSGCTESSFSKMFRETAETGEIVIRDNSGNTTTCNVDVYVDKTPPSCELEVTGEYISTAGWYGEKATVKIKSKTDEHSGLLTYGIGTSLNNRDYNKKETLEVGKGITTVIGYVKDNAGNEGYCAQDVKVGVGYPEFDFKYGYQIYPKQANDNVKYTLSGITESGTNLTTTNTNPTITISDLGKYKDVEQVKITLSEGAPASTNGQISQGSMTETALIPLGTKEIIFLVPKRTYTSLAIRLGTISGVTYKISKIEVFTEDGTIATNKDVRVEIMPKDHAIRTVKYSFDNGANWQTTPYKDYSSNSTNILKTMNNLNMESKPKTFNITKIDKVQPTCSLKTTGTLNTEGTVYLTNVVVSFNSHQDTGGSLERRYGIDSLEGPISITHTSDSNDSVTKIGYIEDNAGNTKTCSISFKKNKVLTLTYDNHDGTGCTTKAVSYNEAYGTLCTPTRVGYTFAGWYTQETGGTSVTATTTVTAKSNHTIHARWTNNSYTINYLLNNGSKGSSAPEIGGYDSALTINNATKTVTVTVNVNGTGANVGSATSKAQTFAGWTYTNGDPNTAKYGTTSATITTAWSNGATKVTAQYFKNLRSTNGEVTLTANWTPVAFALPTVIKTGYTCTINTKADGTGDSYSSGGSYTPEANGPVSITMYARCTPTKYTITLDGNGACVAGNTSTSVTYGATSFDTITSLPTRDVTITYSLNSSGATMSPNSTSIVSSRTFGGWYTAQTGGSLVASRDLTPALQASISGYTNSSKQWTKTDNATVYAYWSGGSVNLPTLTKNNQYTCTWNTNSNGSGTSYNGGTSFIPTTCTDITLYAICTPIEIDVTLDVNGGNAWTSSTCTGTGYTLTGTTCTKKVTPGSTYGTLLTPTREHYNFSEWKYGTTTTIASTTTVTATAAHTLTAQWTAAPKATITCLNNTYNGENQTIASCSGGTISGEVQANANTYSITCAGDSTHSDADPASCSILPATPTIKCLNPAFNNNLQAIASCTTGTLSNHYQKNIGNYSVACTGTGNYSGRVTGTCSIVAGTYNVTLNGNGATTAGSTTTTVTYHGTKLGDITLPIREYTVSFNKNNTRATATTTAKKATYSLKGWYSASSNGNKVANTATKPALQASVSGYTNSSKQWTKLGGGTLYAQWNSSSVVLPTITRSGYMCSWNTKADGTGTDYLGGATYTPTSDKTFYGKCNNWSYIWCADGEQRLDPIATYTATRPTNCTNSTYDVGGYDSEQECKNGDSDSNAVLPQKQGCAALCRTVKRNFTEWKCASNWSGWAPGSGGRYCWCR